MHLYTHAHSHTHTHTCTHTPRAVSHSCININALLFYFLIVDPHTNIVFSCHPIHHMFLFCFSIGAVPLSKLSCVSMCTFMHAHTYTPHTSTSIHLQLRSHVYCLCKFVFPCSGNYQQAFLLPFALLNIMHAHAHTHMHTNPHAHARTFMYTHRSHASITNVCICTHKNGFGSHPTQHTYVHTHTHTYTELASALYNFPAVSCCYEHTY